MPQSSSLCANNKEALVVLPGEKCLKVLWRTEIVPTPIFKAKLSEELNRKSTRLKKRHKCRVYPCRSGWSQNTCWPFSSANFKELARNAATFVHSSVYPKQGGMIRSLCRITTTLDSEKIKMMHKWSRVWDEGDCRSSVCGQVHLN